MITCFSNPISDLNNDKLVMHAYGQIFYSGPELFWQNLKSCWGNQLTWQTGGLGSYLMMSLFSVARTKKTTGTLNRPGIISKAKTYGADARHGTVGFFLTCTHACMHLDKLTTRHGYTQNQRKSLPDQVFSRQKASFPDSLTLSLSTLSLWWGTVEGSIA